MLKRIKLPTKFPVTCHTKQITIGSTFFAINGTNENGTKYIPFALKRGAQKIVIQNDTKLPEELIDIIQNYEVQLEIVENIRYELAFQSSKATGHAHKNLKFIGITGTKGKTSTAFILEHILRKSGYKTALISTVHNKILNTIIKANLTTEQPDYLHQFFKLCTDNNVQYVIMEVAAQALTLHRVADITFDSIIFTNFAQEHGEFYNSLENYFNAKLKIFDQLKENNPVFINADDKWGKKILEKNPKFISFGTNNSNNIQIQVTQAKEQLSLNITQKNNIYTVTCPHIFGEFNSYNVTSAIGLANTLGISVENSAKYLETFKGIPGRLELHTLANGAKCFIDYAHNPSSYEAILPILRHMTDDLTIIFGGGGQRDREKRPIMGKLASQMADKVILTSDNPRTEDPQSIINDIFAGISTKNHHKVQKEPDRKKAIVSACINAKKTSVIAILGKGPDEYQIIGNTKTKFSEKEIIKTFK